MPSRAWNNINDPRVQGQLLTKQWESTQGNICRVWNRTTTMAREKHFQPMGFGQPSITLTVVKHDGQDPDPFHIGEHPQREKGINESASSPQKKNKLKRKRGEISQKDAAALCGVSLRQIQNWDANKRIPEGYPGRSDGTVFVVWANRYRGRKRLLSQAKCMNSARPMSPDDIDSMATRNAFDED